MKLFKKEYKRILGIVWNLVSKLISIDYYYALNYNKFEEKL